jgi:hypothetical protein
MAARDGKAGGTPFTLGPDSGITVPWSAGPEGVIHAVEGALVRCGDRSPRAGPLYCLLAKVLVLCSRFDEAWTAALQAERCAESPKEHEYVMALKHRIATSSLARGSESRTVAAECEAVLKDT